MKTKFLSTLRIPLVFVAIIWGVHVLAWALDINLRTLGVFPRELLGLRGVIFSPLIHNDWEHLISNSTPLLVLSAIVLFFYRKVAVPAFLIIYFLSGLAVWLFARPAFHIGASGFIYGLVAFVFWNGVFRKNIKSIALALIVVFYYGSMIFGVLPLQEEVSWEGHLFGALAGVFASWLFKKSIEADEQKTKYSWELEPEPTKESFLAPDTFVKTKHQRDNEDDPMKGMGNWTSSSTY